MIVAFDVSRRSSFEHILSYWLGELDKKSEPSAIRMLVVSTAQGARIGHSQGTHLRNYAMRACSSSMLSFPTCMTARHYGQYYLSSVPMLPPTTGH